MRIIQLLGFLLLVVALVIYTTWFADRMRSVMTTDRIGNVEPGAMALLSLKLWGLLVAALTPLALIIVSEGYGALDAGISFPILAILFAALAANQAYMQIVGAIVRRRIRRAP